LVGFHHDLSLRSKKIKEEIGWVYCNSKKITKSIKICCGVKKKLKITKLDLMLVNEFMINCRFTTHSKKERNQGFQDGYHKWPMHGSHYT